MPEEIHNDFIRPTDIPTNLDLHREQARQGVILAELRDDVKGIKAVLVGDDQRQGLVMDVDRLKRSRALFHGILWAVFTAAVGTSATVLATYAMK